MGAHFLGILGVGRQHRFAFLVATAWLAAMPLRATSYHYSRYSFTTLAGVGRALKDGVGSDARFGALTSIAIDPSGVLYVADDGRVRKISPTADVTTLSIDFESAFGSNQICIDHDGNLFLGEGSSGAKKVTPDGVVTRFDTDQMSVGFLAIDPNNNLYVSDPADDFIGEITFSNPVRVFAGIRGYSMYADTGLDPSTAGYVDGPGATARFKHPSGVAFDAAGNLWVADLDNSVIRKITPDGQVSTVAGQAGVRASVDGDTSSARFNYPYSITVDRQGNVLVTDHSGLRKISPSGIVTTVVAVDPGPPPEDTEIPENGFTGVTSDAAGNIYLAGDNAVIRKISPAGDSTLFAGTLSPGSADGPGKSAHFRAPAGIAVDAAGVCYVADTGNNTIRKIQTDGTVTTFAGQIGVTGSSDGTGLNATFNRPKSLVVDVNDNIYVADTGNSTVRKISAQGVVTTLAGETGITGSSDGMGAAAHFIMLNSLAIDQSGSLYVGDRNTLRKISPSGLVTTIAGQPGVDGTVDGPRQVALFEATEGIAIGSDGTIYLSDSERIRKITNDGVVSTIARTSGTGLVIDGDGILYTIGFENIVSIITPDGQSTVVGAPANASGGSLLSAIAIDSGGVLYVADSADNTIRKGIRDQSSILLPPAAPVIVNSSPFNLSAVEGSPAYMTVEASGIGNTFQWRRNGIDVPGATSSTYGMASATVDLTGFYEVVVTNAQGSVTSGFIVVTIGWSRLVNVSTRSLAQNGDNVQIGGFIISGTKPKKVLIRANGPALAKYNISGFLPNPTIQLRRADDASTLIATNDKWGNDPTTHVQIAEAIASTGAGSWDFDSDDAAILITLAPGGYTAIVADKNGVSGVTLLEVFDADALPTVPKFVNLSCRSYVASGDNVEIAGFVIAGTLPKKVIIRASGPALAKYKVAGFLADPVLTLHAADGSVLETNDNWDSTLKPAFALAGIDNWDSGSKDAAIITTLSPGSYTAIVSGAGDSSGVALVEVFEAQ